MGLKFMERAQKKEQEALKNEVNLAVKQIKGEDDYESSDSEAEKPLLKNTAKAFGVKALKSASDARVTGTEID